MSRIAKLIGTGIVSALGQGLPTNLQGLSRSQGLYRTLELDGFEEAITAPYLAAVDDTLQLGASDRAAWLLDKTLEEAFANTTLSAEEKRSLPVFIGSSSYGIGLGEERYRQALADDRAAFPLPLDGFTQISKHLRQQHQLLGPDYAFNTACTASANALLSAINSIELGQHPYALVIGLETFNATTLSGFYGMQLLSDQAMRPFDKQRNGLVLGEGCAALLLTADDSNAEKIEGLTLCGGASRCDTYSISASNPDGSSIAEVMRESLANCQLQPTDIVAIKAHGTASPLNDDGEAAGMRRVFETVPDFFSLKSYIGHTLGSCGAMETALMAACLQQRKLPVSTGFENVDDSLGVTPLTTTKTAGAGHYMLNFFGFGGNNCSLIIQQTGNTDHHA